MEQRYKSIWQEFCCDLIEARNNDVHEDEYQKITENSLRQLGWSKLKGELCSKERIDVGSNGQIEPDITMKIGGVPSFVIEMKRPNNIVTVRQERQLLSYMRLRKTSFGLYVGHEIRLYFDSGEDKPLRVWYSAIELEAEGGLEFIDMFLRETFNEQRVENFCMSKASELLSKRTISDFKKAIKDNQDDAIREIVQNYLVKEKNCTKEQVDEYLKTIRFSVDSSVRALGKRKAILKSIKEKDKRDFSKYSLDGGNSYFVKRRFVRELVMYYVELHPSVTFDELLQVFPKELQGTYGVIRRLSEINESSHNQSDLSTRYLMKESQLLRSADGVVYAVSSQWGSYNFPNVLELAKKWGWNIISNK